MKKLLLIGTIGCALTLVSPGRAQAQFDIITGIIKRVIMAIDLKVQRAQTQTILLQDAQKQLENWMQKTRLADISDWVQQQKDLYGEYYQELWQVKHVLQYYPAVKEIISKQARMISGYRQAYGAVMRDGHFNSDELTEIRMVYEGILRQCSSAVDQLQVVINAFVTQMDDGDRLAIINNVSAEVDRNYRRLRAFTQENIVLSLQRAKSEQDINMIKVLYGIR
ncbi:MAG: conjugal transfer protein TraI [Chitinophagaceae bacterium]|nr:conjugal transfer protein TraI [Chitinophagaceae bacterium]